MRKFRGSYDDKAFRKLFDSLPEWIKGSAISSFEIWETDNDYQGLRFKKLHPGNRNIYSIRISRNFRALGYQSREDPGIIVWYWIGAHEKYEEKIKRL